MEHKHAVQTHCAGQRAGPKWHLGWLRENFLRRKVGLFLTVGYATKHYFYYLNQLVFHRDIAAVK